jgi:hypothetical protein
MLEFSHTIEEKYAYVEKYLYGLQLSYACEIPICNHDVMIENSTRNYFERGKHALDCYDDFYDPLYLLNYPIMIVPARYMQSHAFICYDVMIYKMPMHRKKVRLRCYCLYALCCSLPCFNSIIILMDLGTPWDPGIW